MQGWGACRFPAEAGGIRGRVVSCHPRPPFVGAGQGGGPVDFPQKQGAIETGFLVRLGKGSPPPRPLSGGHISEELLAVPRFSPSPPWRARAIAFAKVVLVCRARGDRRAVGSEWLAGGAHERRERRGSARTLGSSTTQTLDHSRAISPSVTGSPCSNYSRMSEGDRSGAEIRFLDDSILLVHLKNRPRRPMTLRSGRARHRRTHQ